MHANAQPHQVAAVDATRSNSHLWERLDGGGGVEIRLTECSCTGTYPEGRPPARAG